jgi:hypothetical protein
MYGMQKGPLTVQPGALAERDRADPLRSRWSDSTGAALLLPDGSRRELAPVLPFRPIEINIHGAQVAEPLIQLDLPSPYYPATADTKEHAYGTPIYFPDGWHGYKYWMVGAPYPTQATNLGGVNATKFENPTIYVSQDGYTWVQPAGIPSNPIFDSRSQSENSGLSYYADPYITYNAADDKLYVIWCWFQRNNAGVLGSLMVSESDDGLTWSAPVSIKNSNSSTYNPNSPSLFYNGAGWTAIWIDTRDGTGTFTVERMTTASATPYSGWGAVTTVTMTHPLSRKWWHMHVIPLAGETVIGMAADNTSSGGSAYTLQSFDGGATFTVALFSATNVAAAGGTWYRPSLCLCCDGTSTEVIAFISRIAPAQNAGFWMQRARLNLNGVTDIMLRQSTREAVHAKNGAPVALKKLGLILWDSFNRTDSSTTLGTADSGQSWTNVTGNWGISANRAYNATIGNNIAVIDTGHTNYDMEVQIQTVGADFWLQFNYVDSSNRFRWNGGTAQKIIGGGIATTYGMTGVGLANGDLMQIKKRGDRVTFFLNDNPIDSIVDTTLRNATIVGFQGADASATYFDNLIVRLP